MYSNMYSKQWCSGSNSEKNCYNSESEAERVREYQEKERGVQLKVYYCMFCNGYHLSSRVETPSRGKKGKKKRRR